MAVGKILVDASFHNMHEKELFWGIILKAPLNVGIMSDCINCESSSFRKRCALYIISFI